MTATLAPELTRRDPSPSSVCGSERGYRRHLDSGERTDCGLGCREAHGRAVKRRLARPVRVPSGRAAAHVRGLVAGGMPVAQIEAAAGVSHDTIAGVLRGQRRIARSTESRLLAVELRLEGRAMVAQTGTARRVQALLRIGWSHDAIREATGVSTKMMARANPTGLVTVEAAERVRVVFDALSMRPGPSTVTASRAARLGYVPPLGWDDESIDDPAAAPATGRDVVGEPDEVTIDLLVEGVLTAARARMVERREAVRILAGRGLDDGQIAQRMSMSRDAVEKVRERNGIGAGVRAAPRLVAS